MSRLVTLFTGQWADLPFAEMARMTKEFGYDGIELACWGDHFEVDKALSDDGYCARSPGEIPPELEASARHGAGSCPEQALTIIED